MLVNDFIQSKGKANNLNSENGKEWGKYFQSSQSNFSVQFSKVFVLNNAVLSTGEIQMKKQQTHLHKELSAISSLILAMV